MLTDSEKERRKEDIKIIQKLTPKVKPVKGQVALFKEPPASKAK